MFLQINNLKFRYDHEEFIINDLTLSLDRGKIYALMGANGSGKTTLFNLISGFKRSQEGDIIFENTKITSLPPYKVNRYGIGRTFQDLRIITQLTVKENVVFSMQNNPTDNWFKAFVPSRIYNDRIQNLSDTANAILEQFFLTEIQHSLAGEISYGQQKLLTLACVTANGASLLLLDEAVAGIQPEYRSKITEILKQLKTQGKTILLIEHNTEFISDLCDKIFFLYKGKTMAFENLEDLKKDSKVMDAYLI